MKNELSPDVVRKVCNPLRVKELFSSDSESGETIIGQDRAVKALKFGLGIKADGYNIYVSGIQGTGKLTAIKNFVVEPAKKEQLPNDWCYVNNFKDLYQPTRLCLPAGHAIAFKKDIKNLILDARQTLTKAFEHEDFMKRRQSITDSLVQRQNELFNAVYDRAAKESIRIQETPVDIVTIPLKNGKNMSDEQFNKLSEEEQKTIRETQDKYIEEIKVVVRESRKLEREASEKLAKLENEVATFAISSLIQEMEEKYAAVPDVMRHLKEVKEDILANLVGFLITDKGNSIQGLNSNNNNFIKRYEVNVLVDNDQGQGAPVVIEPHPTYNNLFGRVEKESYMGTWVTDLTLIRRGSLHTANGGYLIIQVEELFKNIFSWESLKRALKNKEVVIEEAGDQWGFITTKTLKPEPIPLKVKVILIGDPFLYHLLYAYDSNFKELFKVKADFDSSMVRNGKNESDYIRFCDKISKREGLFSLNDEAVAKVIEHGSRLAEDQNKLSTQFSEIANVLREANYYASVDNATQIQSSHIRKAVEEKLYRSNLIQDRLNEMIASKQILIDIKGKKVGQVNGLSVIILGDIDFGIPNRITCSTSLGKDGIIAIEREAELSGPIHTKGVMILTGYLTEKYIQEKPISLNARVVFEQSYGEIEGDSASSSELYTILSSLSNLPIKQGIAVTGSVNQKGEIQAVGGINEKIEGYFEIVKLLGWGEEQGVIIPSANIRNLMLKEEIQEAIQQKKFKIWAIDTIDDGIEILTGLKAGTPQEEGTIAYLVNNKLNQYADKMRAFAIEELEETNEG
jgi:lon-related putative ATP-dependent protease